MIEEDAQSHKSSNQSMNSRADSQASFFSARGGPGVMKGSTHDLDDKDKNGNGAGEDKSKSKNNSGHKQRRAPMSKGINVPKFALAMNQLNENSSIQTTSSNFFTRIFD